MMIPRGGGAQTTILKEGLLLNGKSEPLTYPGMPDLKVPLQPATFAVFGFL
jgi:hypothetical protein